MVHRHNLLATLCLLGFGPFVFADEFFTSKIEPLLRARCFECHSHGKKIKGGLALDSKSGWVKGGESGPALVPNKPQSSLLIKALSHTDNDLKMPPGKMLSPAEIALVTEWIQKGALDPRLSIAKPVAADLVDKDSWKAEFKKRLNWWSLLPMSRDGPPNILGTSEKEGPWSKEPIDRFVLSALEKEHLRPAQPAEPEVLLRRLSFVLTGLPVPPEALKDLALKGPAYEQLVDRFLASPHFGERFARHWMDVVRYTDTYGYEWDNPAKGSHEYRDYLIRAFNDDIGFDQLVREQIAGDLLAKQRIHPVARTHENHIGPMFYHLGEHRHGSSMAFNGVHQEMVNNKIDAFSKAFLATTVACARCHDHKLEAVSQHDYYALAAVFTTPRWTSRVVDAPGNNDEAIAKLKTLRQGIRGEMAQLWQGITISPKALQTAAGDFAKTKPAIDDITYPIMRLSQKDKPKSPEVVALTAWTEAKAEWQAARTQRLKTNANFQTLADFKEEGLPKGWVMEGDGMKQGHVAEATPLVALDGPGVYARFLARGYHTHALSSKLPGAFRMPPQHLVPGDFTSVKMAGGQFGGYMVVDDHAFQNEPLSFLTNPDPQWKTIADAKRINGVQQITLEGATSSLNPNFPPRTGLAGGLDNADFGYDKRSWISLTGIVTHGAGGAPVDELDAFASLYDGPAPKTQEEAWQRIGDWFTGSVKRWCEDRSKLGDQVLLEWLLLKKVLPNQANVGSKLEKLLSEYRLAEAAIPFPRTANSMDERETVKVGYPLNVRGNVDVLGELVKPDFLSMFAGKNDVHKSLGSGRLELAESLLDSEHPITARVYVNRVWQWLFGAGLVATPDDFGRLGGRPSHPQLLDYLAREFIREGWSTKKLVRKILMSQAFRQNGVVTQKGREIDPANRLLHHYPTRRLEAEAIRDSLLFVAGRLDEKLYGRPILPPRTVVDGAKRLFNGPLDGDGRRSIYQQMSIMDPPKFLVGFNLPDLKLPTGRRDVTNVPSQALILLNDPFVEEMAKRWVKGLMNDPPTLPEERVRKMFVRALGREPLEGEKKRWVTAVKDFSVIPGSDLMLDEKAWQLLAFAFFNTTEFIYYR